MTVYDFAIVGAGIAGASLAAELGCHARVLLLEAEERPGYHATGRSAAFWEECYGGPEIVPLTLASGPYLRDHGFLKRRGALYIGRGEDAALVDRFMERFSKTGATIERLGREALAGRIDGLRPDWTEAIWEPACADIDVASLHQHVLKAALSAEVALRCRARVCELLRRGDNWRIACESGDVFHAATIVDAAGAWADDLAVMAGARPRGIQPLRRTVAQLRTDPAPAADMPLVLDIAGDFYFKPEAGSLWLSPHDETPSTPCDAAPEEIDVAKAIARLEDVVDWRIQKVEHRWAGLRSFSRDRLPVYGWDTDIEGFAWFAGQGGFGIQTAPAAARLASQLLLDLPRDAMTESLDASLYDPGRPGLGALTQAAY